MRNAAQLRAAARGTGFYDGYVGDGATVPWQVGFPPLGELLWVYKTYLDFRWPEAFRLHDFLYTPWGQLIQVTRLEADNALREEITLGSPVDALVVYTAVRLGGEVYFGLSQTGYFPPALPGGNGNIADTYRTPFLRPTMPIKCIMIFQQVTDPGANAPAIGYVGRAHIAGWSESVWWAESESVTDAQRALFDGVGGIPALVPARALCLGLGAAIVGVRLYQGGSGKGQFISRQFVGSYSWGGFPKDIPQMALLCRSASSNFAVSRRFTMRGIPDSQVSGGEFSPVPNYVSAVQEYFHALYNFRFPANDPTNPILAVNNVTIGGLVTLQAASPFAIGNFLTFNHLLTASGAIVSYKSFVTAIGPLANQFTIGGWSPGATTRGTVVMRSRSYYSMPQQNTTAIRITTRRVGRPFEQYRGRQSKR